MPVWSSISRPIARHSNRNGHRHQSEQGEIQHQFNNTLVHKPQLPFEFINNMPPSLFKEKVYVALI
jgi:hypothetical protein